MALHALIADLPLVLSQGTPATRSEILRRLTELFLTQADSFQDDHVAVFDQVLELMVEAVERHALIRLGLQLAPLANAPLKTLARLGQSDDIAVAAPVLERSIRLTDTLLVDVAGTKGQPHLAAIAVRTVLSVMVTDVVVERGDIEVTRKITANGGASFSETGFRTIASRAHLDEALALLFAGRGDVPAEVFRDMLRNATDDVRRRLARATCRACAPASTRPCRRSAPSSCTRGASPTRLPRRRRAPLPTSSRRCARRPGAANAAPWSRIWPPSPMCRPSPSRT
jgi:uncharacterized protein (DUF2336 family)